MDTDHDRCYQFDTLINTYYNVFIQTIQFIYYHGNNILNANANGYVYTMCSINKR